MTSQSDSTGPIRPPPPARWAAVGMVVLAAVTTVGVAAYFTRTTDPWTWRGLVALATIPFALVCAGLLWRNPTRENAGAALLVVAFSLVRVGLPGEWTTATYVLMVITAACAAPVIWAARTLPP